MKKLLKSKKTQAIILIVISILAAILGSIFFYSKSNKTIPLLEYVNYGLQIICNIFVIAGVVIAVWQYYLTSKETKTNLEVIQVQRAIDLSEYYKDNVLHYLPAIYYVFDKVGATNILKNLRLNDLNSFDSNELSKLLKPEQIDKLKSFEKSNEFVKAVIEAANIYNLNLNLAPIEYITQENGITKKTTKIRPNALISAFMSDLIADTLNNLEFFALHFHHNVSDDSVVYQSLHQTYLDCVLMLYYYIANYNTNPSNKYFTNVIWLFDKWRETKKQQELKAEEHQLLLQSHGTIIQK